MTVQGTLRTDGLAVASITIDFMRNPIKIQALAALIDTEGGQTLAWTQGDGSVFSAETMVILKELRESMERDIAKRVFTEASSASVARGSAGLAATPGGLGEHLGAEVPQI